MGMTDTIADYLTRLRNAAAAKQRKVDVPASGIKLEITKVLLKHGFIQDHLLIQDGKQGILRIYLKYDNNDRCVINGLQRVSTPGRRHYVGVDKIPRVFNNLGIAILSTPKGIVTDRDARKLHIGGEVLCYVW
jgi:small subunit ribosomal protein S8